MQNFFWEVLRSLNYLAEKFKIVAPKLSFTADGDYCENEPAEMLGNSINGLAEKVGDKSRHLLLGSRIWVFTKPLSES